MTSTRRRKNLTKIFYLSFHFNQAIRSETEIQKITDKNIEEKIIKVENTIKEIGASEIKSLSVFNKIDCIDEIQKDKIKILYNNPIFISAKNNINIENLRKIILNTILELNKVEY